MVILSSYGFDAPIICNEYKKYVKPENKKIIILPFAGYNNDVAAQYERQSLLRYGFLEKDIYVLCKYNMSDMLSKSFDYLYVPGGDTFKLLNQIKELKISDWINQQIKAGTDYIGVSAGAYICCQDIRYLMNLENNNYIADDFSALGLIDVDIICHADQYEASSILACKRDFGNDDYLLIRNDEVYITEY